MSFLRRLQTTRLLALIGALAAAAACTAAIAIAAGGSASPPPAKPLAVALHDALAARPVAGVTARIRFTNHLVDAASLRGSDPVLTGATGRLWASADGRARLELQASDSGTDAQVMLDGRRVTVYDASQRTLYRATLPADKGERSHPRRDRVPTVAQIRRELAAVAQHLVISGARPGTVADRGAYTVRVSPRHDGGLLGGAEVAWDAARGVPLRAAVYAADSSSPVLELTATNISFGKVDPTALTVTPPPGTKVVDLSPPAHQGRHAGRAAKPVEGVAAVRRSVGFALAAPKRLVGLPRTGARTIDAGGRAGALVTYGRGLGGIAVLEQPASGSAEQAPRELPRVSIRGATGTELATALGTVVRFQRDGVEYTVIGSVPPAAAEAAARAL
jgi:hypothetical protein